MLCSLRFSVGRGLVVDSSFFFIVFQSHFSFGWFPRSQAVDKKKAAAEGAGSAILVLLRRTNIVNRTKYCS